MRRSPVHPRNAVAVRRLRTLMAERQPSVVHVHSAVGGALGRVASLGRPVARVYTPHALPQGRAACTVERALGRITDRLITVSESEADLVRRRRIVYPDRIVVIPNGIELTMPSATPGGVTDLRAELGVGPDVPLVGCVARLVAQKAPEDFVRICSLVGRQRPDAEFVLVGAGPQQDLVDRELAAGGLGARFHQVPVLPGVAALLGQLDVFVLPSRFEGGPYTPLEAMRAGVPVVLSDVVGNRDTVEPGVSGELRPMGDVQGMAEDVVALLADEGRRRAMVAAAQARLAERFDVRLMGATLAGVYASLV
jgi:glycosyltransferase involved in cell wall biosynthesis